MLLFQKFADIYYVHHGVLHVVLLFIDKGMKKYDYYIGIDVSKLTLDVTILYEIENITETKYCKIENNEKNIAQFEKNKLCKYDLKQPNSLKVMKNVL